MQSSEVILYNLSKKAEDEQYVFDRLYRYLYNEDFYYKAYCRIYANRGSGTRGVDEETADGYSADKITTIIESLKDESYQPKPARRTYIDKKDGSKRQLGIPSFSDRILQEVCRTLLEAIYEPHFLNCSHGFRPKRSCHTALHQIKETFCGVNWFIEGDIKGFFDNINHQAFIQVLRKRIRDEKFIRLMWKFLKAGYLENWTYYKTHSGTPQGGMISPILANIYLHELDEYVTKTLKTEFDVGTAKKRKRNTEYRKYDMRNQRLKKKIDAETDETKRTEMIHTYKENKKVLLNLPYYDHKNEGYKGLEYVRYADDFIIGVHGNQADCKWLKGEISNFLRDHLKLELSEEKTLITNSEKAARFLSYEISVSRDNSAKKGKDGVTKRVYNRRVKLLIPEGTIEKVILKHGMVKDIDAKEWKILHRPALLGLTPLEIVETYNAELRGLYQYYCLADNVTHKMWQLRYVMEYSCLKTLAGKFKTTIGKVKEKYKQGKYWGIPYETKKETKICFFYKDPLVKKLPSQDTKIDEKPNLYKYQCSSELDKRLRANECEVCGTNDPKLKYEVHHINKMKNLKGKKFWEVIMIGKQRKTLIVCQQCHKDIHRG